MGMYLNPGYDRYEIAMNSDIFVDKTEMIAFTNSLVNTNQRYLSVSRPRRFGKSMATDMLCAYYGRDDSRELFEKTRLSKLDGWDGHLNRFDVIRVIMTDFFKPETEVGSSLDRLKKLILRDIKNPFIRSFLFYVPYVTLAVMTFPAILSATGSRVSAWAAFLVGLLLAYVDGNLFRVAICSCVVVYLTEMFCHL